MSPETVKTIFDNAGTDKSSVHSYEFVYAQIAGSLSRCKGKWVLEIGYSAGCGISGLKRLFPNFHFAAIDLQFPQDMPSDVLALVCDTSDIRQLFKVRDRLPTGEFALIIDDGSHRLNDQFLVLNALSPLIAPNGLFVIEDIQDPADAEKLVLPAWKKRCLT